MKRIAISRNWSRRANQRDIQPALSMYSRYLEDCMLAASTIESNLDRVKLFLEWSGTEMPSSNSYREVLRKKNTSSPKKNFITINYIR